jgi:hypothetical protein
MDTYYAALTVPQLRERILADDPTRKGLSKLRKGELIALLRELESKRAEDEAQDMTGHWAEQGADVDPEDAQVFQGAMHEATTPQAVGDTLRVLANSAQGVADALNTMGLAVNAAAQKLATAAWSHQVAVVRSMGHTVRGKVVDASVRTPDASGRNRVLLVVQHDGHPTRRTLHALADVQFEALAS